MSDPTIHPVQAKAAALAAARAAHAKLFRAAEESGRADDGDRAHNAAYEVRRLEEELRALKLDPAGWRP